MASNSDETNSKSELRSHIELKVGGSGSNMYVALENDDS
jgi:hypothetical protein